jgi:hypothetical protein
MLQRFTSGPSAVVAKLNAMVDELNRLRPLLGGTMVLGQNTKYGSQLGVGIDSLSPRFPRLPAGDSTLNDGLLAWYLFNNNEAKDSSANSRDGTYSGTTSNQDVAIFDKVNDYINCGGKVTDGTDWIGTGPLSIGVWIYARSHGEGDEGRILDNGKTIFQVYDHPKTERHFRFSSDGGTTWGSTNGNVLNLHEWQHVGVNRDANGQCDIYVNGVFSMKNLSSGTPVAGTTDVYIGNDSGTSYTFDGLMDDMRVYNRELSAREWRQLYEYTNHRYFHAGRRSGNAEVYCSRLNRSRGNESRGVSP